MVLQVYICVYIANRRRPLRAQINLILRSGLAVVHGSVTANVVQCLQILSHGRKERRRPKGGGGGGIMLSTGIPQRRTTPHDRKLGIRRYQLRRSIDIRSRPPHPDIGLG